MEMQSRFAKVILPKLLCYINQRGGRYVKAGEEAKGEGLYRGKYPAIHYSITRYGATSPLMQLRVSIRIYFKKLKIKTKRTITTKRMGCKTT